MNISGDTGTGTIDLLKLVEELPKNLVHMAALRDELAKRQGAVSAVEASLKASEEAQTYAKKTKADADALRDEAKAKHGAATAKEKELEANKKAFGDEQVATAKANDAAAKALADREKNVTSREQSADKRDADLKAKLEAYNAEKATFDERVKAFQAKVLALTV